MPDRYHTGPTYFSLLSKEFPILHWLQKRLTKHTAKGQSGYMPADKLMTSCIADDIPH